MRFYFNPLLGECKSKSDKIAISYDGVQDPCEIEMLLVFKAIASIKAYCIHRTTYSKALIKVPQFNLQTATKRFVKLFQYETTGQFIDSDR